MRKGCESSKLACATAPLPGAMRCAAHGRCRAPSARLPHAFGCEDWLALKVRTCAELDHALARADAAVTGVYVYIEIVTGRHVSCELVLKLHDAMPAIYRAWAGAEAAAASRTSR